MSEYLLKTEFGETHTSRQLTKIDFLEQEVLQYKEKIKDLETMLQLNKQALEIAYKQVQIPNSMKILFRKYRKQISLKFHLQREK